ncbi:MAG: aminotransferase class V-fold PLP-dependent enzyme [Actinomycetia bacterium]|nr:aminotransferase class V-fold PLP-dependent enzyme [Actinomycetes bacterium]
MLDHNVIGAEFAGGRDYFNTASLGIPPRRSLDALQSSIAAWRSGHIEPPDFDNDVSAARRSFASLLSVPVEWVAIGSQVSALVGLVTTTLRPGATVLYPEGEFTSVIFPFLVRDDLDLEVKSVPLDRLAEAIVPGVDIVAFSAVQSSNGRVADLPSIRQAARTSGTLTLVDATQAAGWLPINATDFDFVVAGTYKWLLSPRGTAFLTIRPELRDRMRPLYAGWYAGEDPWESIYGDPLRLAADARRFDLSPGWLAWVGTAPALALLGSIGVEAIHDHNIGLANSLLSQLGYPSSNSAIVSLDLDPNFPQARLDGLRVAYRAGRLRVGFHLYNSAGDVASLVRALTD